MTALSRTSRRVLWIALGVVAVAGLVVGGLRDAGPRSSGERAASLAKRVACPTCNGESVYESNATAARGIRNAINALVVAGKSSDEEIIAEVESRFPGSSLVPKASGLESLVWALPAAAAVLAVAGLGFTIRRGRGERQAHGAVWTAGALGIAAVVGWTVAAVAGGDGPTSAAPVAIGSLPVVESSTASTDPVEIKLVEARRQLGADAAGAAAAYLEVLKLDPENIEARTYSAWLVTQQGQQTSNQSLVDAGLEALKSAVKHDPTYADAHCFVAIASARFLETPDMETARVEGQKCLDLGVPGSMRPLVEVLVATASLSTVIGTTAGTV